VLTALAGVLFLHEQVPLRGWIGTVIIMVGATLTGLTEHSHDSESDGPPEQEPVLPDPQLSAKVGPR